MEKAFRSELISSDTAAELQGGFRTALQNKRRTRLPLLHTLLHGGHLRCEVRLNDRLLQLKILSEVFCVGVPPLDAVAIAIRSGWRYAEAERATFLDTVAMVRTKTKGRTEEFTPSDKTMGIRWCVWSYFPQLRL